MKNKIFFLNVIVVLIISSIAYSEENFIIDFLQTAISLMDNKQYEKAIAELERIESSKKEKDSFELYYLLGKAYFKVENDQKAQENLRKSIALKSDFFKSHDYLAASFYYTANYDSAEKEYSLCSELDPQDARAHYMLGKIYQKTKRIPDAIKSLSLSLDLDPEDSYANNFYAKYTLGELYNKIGDTKNAQKYLLLAYEENPKDINTISALIGQMYNSSNATMAENYKLELKTLREASSDKKVRDLQYFQIEEYYIDNFTIIAKENFEPEGELYYYWIFEVYGADGKLIKTINLESSKVLREFKVAYIIGIDSYSNGKRHHQTTNIGFTELPPYTKIKKAVEEEIIHGLFSSAAGTY